MLIAGLSSPRRRTSSSDEGGTIGGDEEDEEYVHDQLPDANEIKAAVSTGDDSWGALPHEEYRLRDKKYSYSYIIRLLDK